jgi:circadian clock protein KaiB
LSDQQNIVEIPEFFKGIALFTPGGDVIYCIDSSKQGRWHLHLCAVLQEYFGLSEPPHFLVPAYTATIDRWLDPRTQEVKIFAEAYPPVLRHQALLNSLFQTGDLTWKLAPLADDLFYPMVLGKYHQKFSIIWENHNLIIRSDIGENGSKYPKNLTGSKKVLNDSQNQDNKEKEYVFQIFVSGRTSVTQRTMKLLHQLLEDCLGHPYTLKVIDVYRHPEQAEFYHITAAPTLVKVWPLPMRKIVGDLENIDKIRQVLLNCK